MNIIQNNQLQDLEIALKNNSLSDFIKIFDDIILYDRIKDIDNDEKQELFTSLLAYLQAYISKDSNYQLLIREGDIYVELREYDKAKESYLKVIAQRQDLSGVYYDLGKVYLQTKEFDKAIDSFKKASELRPDDYWVFSKLGDAYIRKQDYDNAFENYKRTIELNPKFGWGYYDLAEYYIKRDEYENAISNYKKVLELNLDEKSYLRRRSLEKLNELTERISNSTYKEISNIIDEIKELLHTDNYIVTHYTSLSTASALLINESKLRLSEATFLNDTSEGRTLLDYLGIDSKKDTRIEKSYPYIQKPYIGSFVNHNLDNNLTLWRMYGKEGKDEAAGCSLKIDGKNLIKEYTENIGNNSAQWNENIINEFRFYRVAYIDKNSCVSGNNNNDKQIKAKLEKLKTIFKKNEINPNILKKIGEITYLFKTTEYQHENETRLVLSGSIFNEVIDEYFSPARVYIELASIVSSIQKIVIGPKVNLADEWAATFYYALKKKNLYPQIEISTLPYK
nr:tetratricopeptide repeat protein [uncultured Draconibacterium sp.]